MSDFTITDENKEENHVNHTSLIKRKFVPLEINEDKTSEPDSTIRIMQWNILAQGLCKCSDGFVLCPNEALEWSVRQNLILEELLTYSPDILCLQEVDNFKFLQQRLLQAGFKGSFYPKPDSPCLYTRDSNGPDGCAIFWNQKRLSLIGSDNLILQKDHGKHTNQVAIVCKFRLDSKTETDDIKGKEFFVSTTHLKSKSGYHKLRFQQGQYLERWLFDHCQNTPLLLCGDFNAEPCEQVVDVFKKSDLRLFSSYTLLSEDGSEPSYTTWKVRSNCWGKHEEFCHTIDYLFFTPQYFKCLQLLKLPTEEEIGKGRLPSFFYPSDHLSLVADFQLKHQAAL